MYLVHYADSKKAARHIIPIHPSMRKIPDGVEKIAEIIEEVTDTISDDEFDNEEQVLDDELKKTLDEQPSFDYTNSIDIDTNRKKISKIKSFNKNNQEDET